MKKFSFLPKTSPVHTCRPLQAKFYKTFKHFQNQRGTNSATMHVKNSGWGMSNFQDLPKKRNSTSSQHNLLFSCSEDVKLSYQRQSFCQFEAYENNRNTANTNFFNRLNDPCLQWKTYVLKTLNLSDDNEIFRGYATNIELYNALKFITRPIFIQKILTFNLGVAFLKSVSIYSFVMNYV